MKKNLSRKIRTLLFAGAVCAGLFSLSGCAIYDWLMGWIQTAFSTASAYEVSVVDCKNFKVPDQIVHITPKLSGRLSESVREGVVDVSKKPKFQNIRLRDRIPRTKFSDFQNAFFSDKTTYVERTALLRQYCDTYKTNIVIWGATMGDDSGIAFIGWLYRRDLDVITKTEPQKLEEKMSARVQEHTVKMAIANLLQGSIEGRPIGGDGKVADVLIDNKDTILTTTAAALALAVKYMLTPSGGGSEN